VKLLQQLTAIFWWWEALWLLVACQFFWLAIRQHCNKRKENHENDHRSFAARVLRERGRCRRTIPLLESELRKSGNFGATKPEKGATQ
jgi:hypothetical protein